MTVPAGKAVWVDGQLVPWDNATTHLLTHALHCGTGVFEGIRCYATDDGVAAFRCRDHLTRLKRSAGVLSIELRYSEDELLSAIAAVVEANDLTDCYVRPLVFCGLGEFTINPMPNPVVTAVIAWPQGPAVSGEANLRATIPSLRRAGAGPFPPQA